MNTIKEQSNTDQLSLLKQLSEDMQAELQDILGYWRSNLPAAVGFQGSVSRDNIPDPAALKGLVMHARILWTFSAACLEKPGQHDLDMADRAYQYLCNHFHDKEHGGFYWSLSSTGLPHESRKQTYGQAFCIYGLAVYYQLNQQEEVIIHAKKLFHLIEANCRDERQGGYIEAFSREWGPLEDLRLSPKDQNDRKTMNTHLHLIEAYAALYQVWQDEHLKDWIGELLHLFSRHFIDRNTGHLRLFFDDGWNSRSDLVSFGHDIEASWLLLQCAAVIGDPMEIRRYRTLSLLMVTAASEGLDTDGGLWYEYDLYKDEWIYEKHWWPQAEALVGFFNAWELTGDESHLQQCLASWNFIRLQLKDRVYGEWHWGLDKESRVLNQAKAGFWKCPYHNGRACLELIHRINTLTT